MHFYVEQAFVQKKRNKKEQEKRKNKREIHVVW